LRARWARRRSGGPDQRYGNLKKERDTCRRTFHDELALAEKYGIPDNHDGGDATFDELIKHRRNVIRASRFTDHQIDSQCS
jgi:hypothetical protein